MGYWKDLLEIAVRMCVSPEELQQRALEGLETKLEIARKKQAIEMNIKLQVSCWYVL